MHKPKWLRRLLSRFVCQRVGHKLTQPVTTMTSHFVIGLDRRILHSVSTRRHCVRCGFGLGSVREHYTDL